MQGMTTRRGFLRTFCLGACALLATLATANVKPPLPTAGRSTTPRPGTAPVTVDGWLLRESDR